MSSPSSDTDATPLRLDDAEALTETYRTYRAALTRYALGLTGSKAEAHDVVQDVFVKLWERRDTLTVERSLSALLYTMTRNAALNANRRRDRIDEEAEVNEAAGHDAFAATDPPAPDAATHAADLGRRLRRWIDALPPRRHEAFTLSRFHGLSHAEIADVMGLSVRTVDTHIVHALRDLRVRLDALDAPNQPHHDQ